MTVSSIDHRSVALLAVPFFGCMATPGATLQLQTCSYAQARILTPKRDDSPSNYARLRLARAHSDTGV